MISKYNDNQGVKSHMLYATTDDYIVEYNTRSYIACPFDRKSLNYRKVTDHIKNLRPLSMSEVMKSFAYHHTILQHVLKDKIPLCANKRVNMMYLV